MRGRSRRRGQRGHEGVEEGPARLEAPRGARCAQGLPKRLIRPGDGRQGAAAPKAAVMGCQSGLTFTGG
jgi:hypothetical protein